MSFVAYLQHDRLAVLVHGSLDKFADESVVIRAGQLQWQREERAGRRNEHGTRKATTIKDRRGKVAVVG